MKPETPNPEAPACSGARIDAKLRPSDFDLRTSEFFRTWEFGIRNSCRPGAFTLIELLVVIAIIAVLAALLFPAGVAVKRKAELKRAQAELKQVEAAINAYHLDKGFYPPDNPRNKTWAPDLYAVNIFTSAATNTLFYEFSGVKIIDPMPPNNMLFETLDGSAQVRANVLALLGVNGVQNVDIPGGDSSTAKSFVKNLSQSLFRKVTPPSPLGGLVVMGTSVEGPRMLGDINPFRYVSSVATNNPESFDLWVDVIIGSKTNRLCNWSEAPLTVP